MHSTKGSNTPAELKGKWRTPQYVFDYLNKIYNFNLDPYADISNTLCKNFIGEDDNANLVEWRDYTSGEPVSAFCNPDYRQPNIELALGSARREARQGGTVVVLIPNQPAKYWSELIVGQANRVLITLGRISFIHPVTDEPMSGNAGGSAIITYLPRSKRIRHTSTVTDYIRVEAMQADA